MALKFDIAVVGASLAGATLAHLLGSRGYHVALLDKATFPRRKACGEGLSARGVRLLEQAGITLPSSEETGITLRGYELRWPDNAQLVDLSQPNEWPALGIPRFVLDNLVLSHAQAHPSVEYFGATSVRRARTAGTGFEIDSDAGSLACVVRAKYKGYTPNFEKPARI